MFFQADFICNYFVLYDTKAVLWLLFLIKTQTKLCYYRLCCIGISNHINILQQFQSEKIKEISDKRLINSLLDVDLSLQQIYLNIIPRILVLFEVLYQYGKQTPHKSPSDRSSLIWICNWFRYWKSNYCWMNNFVLYLYLIIYYNVWHRKHIMKLNWISEAISDSGPCCS